MAVMPEAPVEQAVATADVSVPLPQLNPIYADNFDVSHPGAWSRAFRSVLQPSPFGTGQALHFQGIAHEPLYFSTGNIGDVTAQARFVVNSGAVFFGVRESQAGSYKVRLSADGALTLWRGEMLVGGYMVANPAVWHTIALATIGSDVQVIVDTTTAITYTDSAPLPSGMVFFTTDLSMPADVWVDDFSLSGTQTSAPVLYPFPESAEVWSRMRASGIVVPQVNENRIVFNSSGRGGGNEIWIMDSNGGGQTNLSNNPAFDAEPAWSPDGTRIAFVSGRTGNEEIFFMDATGGNLSQMTINDASDRQPIWAPDGNRIAFSRSGIVNTQICILRLSDGILTCFPPPDPSGCGIPYDWSPSGQYILLDTHGCSPNPVAGIDVITPDGTYLGQLMPGGYAPAWSPNSGSISYSNGGLLGGDIYVYNTSNFTTRQLTNTGGEYRTSWSGDSNFIVFDSIISGKKQIYRVPASANPSTGWINLSNNNFGDFETDWSPGIAPVGPTATPTRTPTPTLTPTRTPTPTSTPTSTPVSVADTLVGFDPNRFSQHTLNECTSSYLGTTLYYCWAHVSMLDLVSLLNQKSQTLTHRVLMEIIVNSEYRAYIRDFEAQYRTWPNEAVARRFYDTVQGCGTNGCQGDELYSFLSYYQAALARTLDDSYRQILFIKEAAKTQSYWASEVNNLEISVNNILVTPGSSWSTGILAGKPYGFGVARNVNENTLPSYKTCNSEGFATVTERHTDGKVNIMFGTTLETDGEGICKYI